LSDSYLIPKKELKEEALRLILSANENNVTLRLFGGMAVHFRCQISNEPGLCRLYGDLDFLTDRNSLPMLDSFFQKHGYHPDRVLNTLYGDRRQLYFDEINQRQVDILVDHFEMCHQIPMYKRIHTDEITIPLAELLLTKTQIIQMNLKDALDICSLLIDHAFGDSDGEIINFAVITGLCGDDWGLYTTVSENIEIIKGMLNKSEIIISDSLEQILLDRLEQFAHILKTCPKTSRWKLRSILAKRIPWYDEVEEVRR
jgi:hypothetical protein